MTRELTTSLGPSVLSQRGIGLPSLLEDAGENASRRYAEYFAVTIRNKGTRAAYLHSANQFFNWCDCHGITLQNIEPIVVAVYIEQLCQELSPPTVKLRLAALRSLFDFLVTGHILQTNPAASVKGPRHVIQKGKTPVLTAKEARQLLDSIDVSTIKGLRDRALIGLMLYSFARISAALKLNHSDYRQRGRRMWFRLREKGGRYLEIPAHHNAEAYLDEYLSSMPEEISGADPIFRTLGRDRRLTQNRMHRTDALRMIKRRAAEAGLSEHICCHTCRGTGITAYLQNGGTLEHAMQIAGHASASTTKLYDRRTDDVSLDEIERIWI